MNKQTRDIVIGGLSAGALAVWLYYTLAERSAKVDLSPYSALGAVTAEETARLLGNKGRVLVIARDTGENKNPSIEAELAAFARTLKRVGLTQATERFEAAPMLMMATGGGAPPEHLAKALAAHADVGALVLFCALPPLEDSEVQTLKQRGIKTIVVSSFRPHYAQLLQQGVIHLAIVPRPDGPPPDGPPPRTLRQRFDQDYIIITPAGAASDR